MLKLGTWNVSHWTAARGAAIAFDISAHILAVQETHLAPTPLRWAKTTCKQLGMTLHHGAAAHPVGDKHGKSCGVGFVTKLGVAVTAELPSTSAWRMLNAECRLQVLSLPRRPDLPHGLLLVSVYAPLQSQATERRRFNMAFAAFTHELDLQRPTLLMGDFNGTIGGTNSCSLLAHLLGPAGAWVDIHSSSTPNPEPTYHCAATSRCRGSSSRIDLILASRSAVPLVQHVKVLSHI